MTKTWFITGASRGFGQQWAAAALDRGDRVAATARDVGALDGLVRTYGDAVLPIALEVTDRAADFAAVEQAHSHFGRLDVIVNNAGFGHFGFVEELSEAEVRSQLETNFFGALWVTQAAIPLLRSQRSGHILQVSSMGGVIAVPSLAAYNASKWALEGLSEALAQELRPDGIHVTLIEPGSYATDWAASSATHSEPLPVYQPFRDAMARGGPGMLSLPAATTIPALFACVDAPEPPLRLLLGSFAYDTVTRVHAERVRGWADWESVTRGAG